MARPKAGPVTQYGIDCKIMMEKMEQAAGMKPAFAPSGKFAAWIR